MSEKVAIIENSDSPEMAEFIYDDYGEKLIFDSYEDADEWLSDNFATGVVYKLYDGK